MISTFSSVCGVYMWSSVFYICSSVARSFEHFAHFATEFSAVRKPQRRIYCTWNNQTSLLYARESGQFYTDSHKLLLFFFSCVCISTLDFNSKNHHHSIDSNVNSVVLSVCVYLVISILFVNICQIYAFQSSAIELLF